MAGMFIRSRWGGYYTNPVALFFGFFFIVLGGIIVFVQTYWPVLALVAGLIAGRFWLDRRNHDRNHQGIDLTPGTGLITCRWCRSLSEELAERARWASYGGEWAEVYGPGPE